MVKKSVYLETSLISYLTNRLSRDIVTAGHQVITRDWWEMRRGHFALFVNAQCFRAIRAHCEDRGYGAPIICTPEELSGEYAYDVERSNR